MRDFRNCFLFLSFLIEIRMIYLGNLAVPVVRFVHGYLFSYAGSVLRKFAPMISISAFFSFSRRPAGIFLREWVMKFKNLEFWILHTIKSLETAFPARRRYKITLVIVLYMYAMSVLAINGSFLDEILKYGSFLKSEDNHRYYLSWLLPINSMFKIENLWFPIHFNQCTLTQIQIWGPNIFI